MDTIFVSIFHGSLAGNALDSGLLEPLKAAKDLRVVLLSPKVDNEYVWQRFAGGNIVLEPLHESISRQGTATRSIRYSPSTLRRALLQLRGGLFAGVNRSASARIFQYEKYKAEAFRSPTKLAKFTLYYAPLLAGKAMRVAPPVARTARRFLEHLDAALFPDKEYGDLFNKYKPSLVFSIYSNSTNSDLPVLKRAAQEKVPIVSYIQSWDNLTVHGELAMEMDGLIVWNNILRKEAVEWHYYRPEQVAVSGVPQFDHYFKSKESFSSKEVFFNKVGADPCRKLLTYTMTLLGAEGPELDIIEILAGYVAEGKFDLPCQLLIRPRGDPAYYLQLERFKKYANVIIDPFPLRSVAGQTDFHLAETLMHSDVVINIASTITIEACIFDTPVVNIGFDGKQAKPYWQSMLSRYFSDSYKHVTATNGVRIAQNKEELLEQVNAYVNDPNLDREGRIRIVQEQCQYTDGRSGERAGKSILDFLAATKHRQVNATTDSGATTKAGERDT